MIIRHIYLKLGFLGAVIISILGLELLLEGAPPRPPLEEWALATFEEEDEGGFTPSLTPGSGGETWVFDPSLALWPGGEEEAGTVLIPCPLEDNFFDKFIAIGEEFSSKAELVLFGLRSLGCISGKS